MSLRLQKKQRDRRRAERRQTTPSIGRAAATQTLLRSTLVTSLMIFGQCLWPFGLHSIGAVNRFYISVGFWRINCYLNPSGVVVKYVPMFLFTLFISRQGHRIFLHHVNSYHIAWNKQTQATTSFSSFSFSVRS